MKAFSKIGIISACAERTDWRTFPSLQYRDHLRVCGADFRVRMGGITVDGSSPRVRSGLSNRAPL